MASFDPDNAEGTRAPVSDRLPWFPFVVVGIFAACASLTAFVWIGHADVELLAFRTRPAGPPVWRFNIPGTMEITDVRTDAGPLYPEIEFGDELWRAPPGTWSQRAVRNLDGGDRATIIYFVAGRARPSSSGRRYSATFRLRSRESAPVVVVSIWVLGLAAALGIRAGIWRRLRNEWARLSVPQACVLVAAAAFTLFCLRYAVGPADPRWVAALSLPALPLFLERVSVVGRAGWLWVAGILAWAAIGPHVLVASLADPTVTAQLALACAAGFVMVCGLRGRLAGVAAPPTLTLLLMWTGLVAVVLIRSLHVDPLKPLALLGLPGAFPLNPWTEKFSVHWLLAFAGWLLLGHSNDPRASKPQTLYLYVLVALVLLASGSKMAIVAAASALLAGMTALRWPTQVRRLLFGAAIVSLLAAPLISGIPWRLRHALPEPLGSRHLELSVRGGVWEYSRQRIVQRPLTGWGLGSGPRLPRANAPLGEVLDVPAAERRGDLHSHAALPGGHPHSLFLLLWMDLGLVGVILFTGLLVTLSQTVGAYAGQRRVHACLIGLSTLMLVYFAANYPAWHPSVLALAWMTVAFWGAHLPRAGVGVGLSRLAGSASRV